MKGYLGIILFFLIACSDVRKESVLEIHCWKEEPINGMMKWD